MVLGPQRLALDDERVGPHRHLEVGDVQERPTDPRQRRPVPGAAADDPVAREHAELAVGGPRREHPLLDRRVGMTGIFEAGHDRADYGAMIRYLSLTGSTPCPTEVAAEREPPRVGRQPPDQRHPGRSNGPEGDITYHFRVGDGDATFGAGEADDEDVRMEQQWSTAVAVATGELNAQEAFICGQILLFGDQHKLLDAQPVFGALDAVFASVRERTSYE